jgi:serine/threonine protein kinase
MCERSRVRFWISVVTRTQKSRTRRRERPWPLRPQHRSSPLVAADLQYATHVMCACAVVRVVSLVESLVVSCRVRPFFSSPRVFVVQDLYAASYDPFKRQNKALMQKRHKLKLEDWLKERKGFTELRFVGHSDPKLPVRRVSPAAPDLCAGVCGVRCVRCATSDGLKEIVRACLVPDPSKRLDAHTLLAHPYFDSRHERSLRLFFIIHPLLLSPHQSAPADDVSSTPSLGSGSGSDGSRSPSSSAACSRWSTSTPFSQAAKAQPLTQTKVKRTPFSFYFSSFLHQIFRSFAAVVWSSGDP